jgi:hypothetical protein
VLILAGFSGIREDADKQLSVEQYTGKNYENEYMTLMGPKIADVDRTNRTSWQKMNGGIVRKTSAGPDLHIGATL